MTLTILWAALAVQGPAQYPSPNEILSKVNRTYNNLESYMDWGSISFSYRSATGERRGETRTFNTGFKRPNRLRYEFVEPAGGPAQEKRWVTWTSARSGYVTWTNWLPRETDRVTLQKSMFRSWGMWESCGLSLKMLVPWAFSGPRCTEIYKPRLQTEDVDGHRCWKILGVCEDGAEAGLWVDESSSLIVKYRHALDAQLDGKPTNEIYTVSLHPRSNPQMTPDSLRFIPLDERGSHRHTRRSRRTKHSHTRRRKHR